MKNPRDKLFEILNRHMMELDNPSFCDSFFTDEEECPFGGEIFHQMEKGVTLYREEFIQVQVPSEVHIRLHQVIRSRWIQDRGTENDMGGI